MAIIILMLLLLPFLVLHFKRTSNHNQSSMMPTNWPIVGMMPMLITNMHRIHEAITDVLKETGATFVFKGPWFADMDYVVTSDPENIHYILSKNFSNYTKGASFKKIFELYGDAVVNADSHLWEIQRKTIRILMSHPKFQDFLEGIIWDKVGKGLIPFLENTCDNSRIVNLQEVFQRLSFDIICMLLFDHDPLSLSLDLPYVGCEKAFSDTEEAIFYRHLLPKTCWMLQRTLNVGKEKKLRKAWQSIDEFIYKYMNKDHENDNTNSFSLLTSLIDAYKETGGSSGDPKKFTRDALLSLMLAGKSTISANLAWFFCLLSRNPLVEIKIHEEIKSKIIKSEEKQPFSSFNEENSQKLVYLHGALCEALRLYPPVSVEQKALGKADILPSGHKLSQNSKIMLIFYSVGRMETVWGNDCLEFKPERWITDSGSVRRIPFAKFPAFNGGPRTCIGINMAFTEMKAIAATIIYNYKIEVVEDQTITPSNSIILEMKNGLNVKVSKRSI